MYFRKYTVAAFVSTMTLYLCNYEFLPKLYKVQTLALKRYKHINTITAIGGFGW
jgi:hypothetical protein